MIMLSDINDHCLSFQIKVCETCQHTERNKNLARTVRPIKVDAPWDVVGIDLLGVCLTSLHSVLSVLLSAVSFISTR